VSEAAYHPFFILIVAVVISERGDVREGRRRERERRERSEE
jgi:hypothetical protein